jgi:hypothetical protein
MRLPRYVSTLLIIGILSLVGGAVLSGGLLAEDSKSSPTLQVLPDSTERSYDPYERERTFLRQRTFRGQGIEPKAYDKAKEQWNQLPRAVPSSEPSQSTAAPSAVTSLIGTVWMPIGPSPINQGNSQVNGRVSSIAINPNNPNVIYQGASGGGVWRTINGGKNWTPLTDQQVSLGTGEPSAIAIDPNNTDTIYVGTSGLFTMNISKGILKSTDGGGSWIVLGVSVQVVKT